MKKENTPENKAKFFALHFMQPVFRNKHWVESEPNEIVSTYILNTKMELSEGYLLLTPLKNISDEDAIEASKVQSWRRGFDQDAYNFKQVVILMGDGSLGMPYEITDFLRSKSYLLPYMDLSVEDLIAYGWAKES